MKPIQTLYHNGSRAKVAIYAMYAFALGYLVLSIATFFAAYSYHNYGSGGLARMMVNLSKIKDVDRMVLLASLTGLVFLLLNGVAFIIWFYRAYLNYEKLSQRAAHKPFMAILGWFIPFFNLWSPFDLARDMAAGYINVLRIFPDRQQALKPVPNLKSLTGWWWGSFVLASVGARWMTGYWDANTMDEVVLQTMVLSAITLLQGGAAILAAYYIAKMNSVENTIFAIWQSGEFEEKRQEWFERKTGGAKSNNAWYKKDTAEPVEQKGPADPFAKP